MNFNQLIKSYSEEMIHSLQELIRIRSVEDLNGGGYPFGTGVHQCLMECLAMGKSMGFTPDGEYPIINGEKGIVNAAYRFRMDLKWRHGV